MLRWAADTAVGWKGCTKKKLSAFSWIEGPARESGAFLWRSLRAALFVAPGGLCATSKRVTQILRFAQGDRGFARMTMAERMGIFR